MGVTEDDIREARQAAWAFSAASLDAPLSDQEDGNLTQIEIGQRLGISQMHVSRLLARALAYLRDQLISEPGRNTPGGLRYTGAR